MSKAKAVSNPLEATIMIMFHQDLANLNYQRERGYINVDKLETLVATDGRLTHSIMSELGKDPGGKSFSGRSRLTSPMLRGIRDLVLPVITAHTDKELIEVKFQLGNQFFTQRYTPARKRDFYHYKSFGWSYCEVMFRRMKATYEQRNELRQTYPAVPLEWVEELLREGTIIKRYTLRTETWEVMKETSLTHFNEIADDGLLVKHTVAYFNGGRKEEITYIVVSGIGEVNYYTGSNPNFFAPNRVGYVTLAKHNPAK